MSVTAYQKAAQKNEEPRQVELRAFAHATRGLIEAAKMSNSEIGRRAEALSANRRLWTLLASDCAAEGNGLSAELRAQIISLSIFVDKQSRAVIRENESFDVLIDINRTVMEGLSADAPAPAAAE